MTEEQHFVVGGPQLGQDTIQKLKLSRRAEQVRAEGARLRMMGQDATYIHLYTRRVCSKKTNNFKLYIPAHNSARITEMLRERLLENKQKNGLLDLFCH